MNFILFWNGYALYIKGERKTLSTVESRQSHDRGLVDTVLDNNYGEHINSVTSIDTERVLRTFECIFSRGGIV